METWAFSVEKTSFLTHGALEVLYKISTKEINITQSEELLWDQIQKIRMSFGTRCSFCDVIQANINQK